MKHIHRLLSLCLIGSLLMPIKSNAEEYHNDTYIVKINRDCEEGMLTCHKVNYHGINNKTNQEIRLVGSTHHTICADGATPCRFIGYVFKNGLYTYLLIDKRLEIRLAGKTIYSERVKDIGHL
jgi:hypothetical protein